MVYKNPPDSKLIGEIATFLWHSGFGTIEIESRETATRLINYLEENGYSITLTEKVYH